MIFNSKAWQKFYWAKVRLKKPGSWMLLPSIWRFVSIPTNIVFYTIQSFYIRWSYYIYKGLITTVKIYWFILKHRTSSLPLNIIKWRSIIFNGRKYFQCSEKRQYSVIGPLYKFIYLFDFLELLFSIHLNIRRWHQL